jgi:hypothetical protein
MNKIELIDEITKTQNLIKHYESVRAEKDLSPGDKISFTHRIKTQKRLLNELLTELEALET